jgi:hypothetical protein
MNRFSKIEENMKNNNENISSKDSHDETLDYEFVTNDLENITASVKGLKISSMILGKNKNE